MHAANHLSLIRSFLIDSDLSQAFATHLVQIIFCTAFALHKIAVTAKTTIESDEKSCRAALAGKNRYRKKALFHRMFCNV
jgi:hypothetical protein